jgi:4'-phosphopantetheinyl transferase
MPADFLSAEELADLNATPAPQRRNQFVEYWTLKESYIKARSMGLSVPLDRFSFHLEIPGRVRITMDPDLEDSPTRWEFWQ